MEKEPPKTCEQYFIVNVLFCVAGFASTLMYFCVLQGLPQTPKSGAKSCPYNGVEHASHAQEWATTPDDDNVSLGLLF